MSSEFPAVGKLVVLGVGLLVLLPGCVKQPRPTPPTPTPILSPAPAVTPSATPKKVGERVRFQNFVHVSELYKEGVSEGFGRCYAIAEVADRQTLISVDHNASQDQLRTLFKRVEAKRPGFSLYLEGPGGPTGENGEFSADELMRIAQLAQRFCQAPVTDPHGAFVDSRGQLSLREQDYEGYTTSELDSLPWMTEWNSRGWPRYFREVNLPQLRGAKPFNGSLSHRFVSTEIDNLYRYQEATGKSFGEFLHDFEGWVRADGNGRVQDDKGLDIRLVLKNLNHEPDDLAGVLAYAAESGSELFAGFHVAEVESEDFPGQKALEQKLAPLGITTVVSLDTNDYLATTFPGHRERLTDPSVLQELVRVAEAGRDKNGSKDDA